MTELNAFWQDWMATEIADLMSGGMKADKAETAARQEAAWRQSIESHVGRYAATQCDVIVCRYPDGRQSVFAKVQTDDIPEPLRPAAEAWASAPLHASTAH